MYWAENMESILSANKIKDWKTGWAPHCAETECGNLHEEPLTTILNENENEIMDGNAGWILLRIETERGLYTQRTKDIDTSVRLRPIWLHLRFAVISTE